ncbi:MAG: hypothetical protein P0S96_05780 [Simkaniaceae bacterium]|nr:hypothetical protein [Candidatus Sacchlamyda saccharinae]
MRIETVFAPPQSAASSTQGRWARSPSTASSLTSPHAPKWGDKILAFFDWAINKFLSIFTWWMPKKATPKPPGPPPEFTRAVQQALDAEIANRNPIPGLIQGLIIQRGILYLMGRTSAEFYASQAIRATGYTVDKIANFTFPKASVIKKQAASTILSNAVIYAGCKHFDYPYPWIMPIIQSISIFALYTKAEAEKTQKRQALLHQAVAN